MWPSTDIGLAINDYSTINDYGYFGFSFSFTFTFSGWGDRYTADQEVCGQGND